MRGEIALSLAFHQGDFRGAQILLDTIELMESMKHVDVVFSIMGGAEALDDREWMDFNQKATGIFRKVYVNKVRTALANQASGEHRDWRPNNLMFRGVADYFNTLAYHKKKDASGQIVDDLRQPYIGAFYYLEPDCAILKKDWFSQLCAEYKTSRKPFLGAYRDTARLVKDNRKLPPHINGSAIYPNPCVNHAPALVVAAMNDHPEAAPFDVLAGPTVVPLAKQTRLIYVDFQGTPNINPEAVVWHGDKQYQTNLTTIEEITGISPERPHFQNAPSAILEQMPTRIHESLTGVPAGQDYNAQAISSPQEFAPTAESLRAKAARILAQAEAQEARDKAASDSAQPHGEVFGQTPSGQPVLTRNQLFEAVHSLEAPVQPELDSTPKTEPSPAPITRKPEQAYRAVLEEVGHDPLAMARAMKWLKAQQKKAKEA